jgi:hypothetical protein
MVMVWLRSPPIKAAVIAPRFLLGYEGQAREPGAVGADHSLRYDQQPSNRLRLRWISTYASRQMSAVF